MDKTAVKSNSMTASRANALNKSRVKVSTLTCNMWREDKPSLVLELKLVMQHLLNISGLNHVAIHVTDQRQSGVPSDLSISSGFTLHCSRRLISVYRKQPKQVDFGPLIMSKLPFTFLLLLIGQGAQLWNLSQALLV